MNPTGHWMLMTGMYFSLMCLSVALLASWRSRANYELWLKRRRLSYLSQSRHQLSVAESGFAIGRLALLASILLFLLLMA